MARRGCSTTAAAAQRKFLQVLQLLLVSWALLTQQGSKVCRAAQQGGGGGGSRRRNTEIALLMSTRGEDEVELRSDGGRRAQVSCRGDAGVCRDPLRNPGGGLTCCWNRICKDTEADVNHCGRCGRRCRYGLHCCGGSCVNLLWDDFNCGCCGTRCWSPSQCAFGMCGYGAVSSR